MQKERDKELFIYYIKTEKIATKTYDGDDVWNFELFASVFELPL